MGEWRNKMAVKTKASNRALTGSKPQDINSYLINILYLLFIMKNILILEFHGIIYQSWHTIYKLICGFD